MKKKLSIVDFGDFSDGCSRESDSPTTDDFEVNISRSIFMQISRSVFNSTSVVFSRFYMIV